MLAYLTGGIIGAILPTIVGFNLIVRLVVLEISHHSPVDLRQINHVLSCVFLHTLAEGSL